METISNNENCDASKNTLKMLIKEGLIKSGQHNIMIDYQGKSLYADVDDDGNMSFDGQDFPTISALALHMKRQINPALRQDSGWSSFLTPDGLTTLKELKDKLANRRVKLRRMSPVPDYSNGVSQRSTRSKSPTTSSKSFNSTTALDAKHCGKAKSPSGSKHKVKIVTINAQTAPQSMVTAASRNAAAFGVQINSHQPSSVAIVSNGAVTEAEACYVCKLDDHPEKILLCDSCDGGFHLHCLDPPLERVPDGHWYCSHCLSKQEGKTGSWLRSMTELLGRFYSSINDITPSPPSSRRHSIRSLSKSYKKLVASMNDLIEKIESPLKKEEILTSTTGELLARLAHLPLPSKYDVLMTQIDNICAAKDTLALVGNDAFSHNLGIGLNTQKLLWILEVYRTALAGRHKFHKLLTNMLNMRKDQLSNCEATFADIAARRKKEKQDRVDAEALVEEKSQSVLALTAEWEHCKSALCKLHACRQNLFNDVITNQFAAQFQQYLQSVMSESGKMTSAVMIEKMEEIYNSLVDWKRQEDHFQCMILGLENSRNREKDTGNDALKLQCDIQPLWQAFGETKKRPLDAMQGKVEENTGSVSTQFIPAIIIERHLEFYKTSINTIQEMRTRVKETVQTLNDSIADILPDNNEIAELTQKIYEHCESVDCATSRPNKIRR